MNKKLLIKIITVIVLSYIANQNAFAQRLPGTRHFEGFAQTIAYVSGKTGIDVKINYSIDFYSRIDASGDTMPGYCLQANIGKGGYVHYNGKKYSRAQIGEEAYNAIDVRYTDFHADIYDGSTFITHIDFERSGNYLTTKEIHCPGKNWGTIFEGAGTHQRNRVTFEQAKSVFYSPNFKLKNLGEFDTETSNYHKAIVAINKLENEESDGDNSAENNPDQTSSDTKSNSSNNNSNESSSNTSSNNSNESSSNTESGTTSKQDQQHLDNVAAYEKMQRQTAQNTQAAATTATAMAFVLYKIAGFIYSDLGYNSGNPFSGDAPSAKLHFGLGFATAPVYDNTSQQGGSAQAHQTTTVDFNTRMEVWPLQSRGYGVGLISDFSAGTDLIFQNRKLEGQLGVQAYVGMHKWKGVFSLYRGQRNQFFRSWIDASETGPGATVRQRYTRVETGGIYSWWTQYNGLTRAHAQLSATFEYPRDGSAPRYLTEWQRGISGSIYFENRIKYFAEVYPNYIRLGDREFMTVRNTKATGVMIKAGASRCLDDNAQGNYRYPSKGLKHTPNAKHSLFMDLNLSQLAKVEIDETGPSNTYTAENISNNFMSGAGLGYSFDYRLSKHYGISTGLGASIRSFNFELNSHTRGRRTQFIDQIDSIGSGNDVFKYSETALNIPIALFYTNNTSDNNVFWIKGGIKVNQVLRAKLYNAGYSRYEIEDANPFKAETEVEIMAKRKNFLSNFISIGIDYKINGTDIMRCGLELERDRTDALNASIPTRFFTGRLVIGFTL